LREGAEDPCVYGPFQPIDPWTPPEPGNRESGYHQGHPRDVRIIPRSRDFH
jgi:error-prone DNA polymerase